MPSTNPRIKLTVSQKIETQLQCIADQEGTSIATVALDLLTRALELREDEWLLEVAIEREQNASLSLDNKQTWR